MYSNKIASNQNKNLTISADIKLIEKVELTAHSIKNKIFLKNYLKVKLNLRIF